jgi:hypothetical protein
MNPGATVFTVMPRCAISSARPFVNPNRPAFGEMARFSLAHHRVVLLDQMASFLKLG